MSTDKLVCSSHGCFLLSTNMFYRYTVWGVVMVCLLLFAMSLLENIITRPIVQTSRESNVPGWLLLPIVGCFTAGIVLLFSPSSVISSSAESSTSNWVGVLYIICVSSTMKRGPCSVIVLVRPLSEPCYVVLRCDRIRFVNKLAHPLM